MKNKYIDVVFYKMWKRHGVTSFVLIPTLSFLRNTDGDSINVTWLIWDLSFEFNTK